MNNLTIIETCLYAEDLEKAEQFYRDVLELEPVFKESGRHLFFKCGSSMLLIFNPDHTSKVQTEVDGAHVPLHGSRGSGHIAFATDPEKYSTWKERLKRHDVPIESEVDWPGGDRSFYFRDPAGNSLEIISGNLWG